MIDITMVSIDVEGLFTSNYMLHSGSGGCAQDWFVFLSRFFPILFSIFLRFFSIFLLPTIREAPETAKLYRMEDGPWQLCPHRAACHCCLSGDQRVPKEHSAGVSLRRICGNHASQGQGSVSGVTARE